MAKYLDNQELLDDLKSLRNVTRSTNARDWIKNPLYQKFLLMSTRISSKQNFKNYSFRKAMILSGSFKCFIHSDKFDPKKGTNAFAYFTSVIMNQFVTYIKRRKLQGKWRSQDDAMYKNYFELPIVIEVE